MARTMIRAADLPSPQAARMAAVVMSQAVLPRSGSARSLRQFVLAACAVCLPLSGLNASAGADASAAVSNASASSVAETSVVEGFVPAITAEPVLDIAAPALPAARAIAGGSASYYASKFEGRPTASGERYRAGALTAAHRSLPFGSLVRVTNPVSGKSVTVRINDRGPFARGRVIDVSRAAAEELGLIARGHAPVELELIEG